MHGVEPQPVDVTIEDIAHALSMLCRFGGHVDEFYSVAQHSVLVSLVVARFQPDNHALHRAALLHDASEAYLIDLPRPIKRDPTMYGYRAAEERLAAVTEAWLRLPLGAFEWPAVKRVDAALLMTEARDLLTALQHHEGNTPRLRAA